MYLGFNAPMESSIVILLKSINITNNIGKFNLYQLMSILENNFIIIWQNIILKIRFMEKYNNIYIYYG